MISYSAQLRQELRIRNAVCQSWGVTQACSFGGQSVIGIRSSRGAEKRERATVSGSDD